MSEIVRDVRVWAVTPAGNPGREKVYRAVVDTGATVTVVPRQILRDLKHKTLPAYAKVYLHGEAFPQAFFLMSEEDVADSRPHFQLAAVSDEYASRSGDGIDFILGHDYLQAAKAVLRYNAVPHTVSCEPLTKSKGRRRK